MMNVVLNNEEYSVFKNGEEVHLTPKEYGILEFLMSHPEQVFSAEEIYGNVWKEVPYACRPIISVHVRHLREKIEANPECPRLITMLWGKGYRYNP